MSIIMLEQGGPGRRDERAILRFGIPPPKNGLICVVDESGDDYLHPKRFFRMIALPQDARKAVLAAA